MRLGGPVFVESGDPEAFANAHVKKGYTAAYCPGDLKAGQADIISRYKEALKKNNIVLAEVGAWCNPLSKDEEEGKKNITYVTERLALADEIGAATCVNIIGSWDNEHWYGPCACNFKEDFFNYAVEVSRKIIDAVKPKNTKMSFEIMPFSFLDSASEYVRFLKALDRKDEAAVHFDPINCINSPRVYFDNAAFIKEEFRILKESGEVIVSMHLKDLDIRHDPPSVMFDEVQIGTGGIDYVSLLKEIDKLCPDMPTMIEHLPDEAAYDAAAKAVRGFAEKAGVSIK